MNDEKAMIVELGNAATDVFEQMLKGNWRDDHGHDVRLNKAMCDLKAAVERAMVILETK